jgi:hypothetical protein
MGDFAVDRLLRAVRRLADVSQRELAARAGLGNHVVVGAELKPHLARVVDFSQLLAAVGFRLVVVDRDGREVLPETLEQGQLVDRRSRRYPAHLDVRSGREGWWGDGWPMFDGNTPLYTFDRNRGRRDWRRDDLKRDARIAERSNGDAS